MGGWKGEEVAWVEGGVHRPKQLPGHCYPGGHRGWARLLLRAGWLEIICWLVLGDPC